MAYTPYYPGCDESDLPDYIPEFCEEDYELGRVRSVAFIHKDVYATIVASPLAATFKTAIGNKKVLVVPKVLGSYDGGAAVEATGYGDKSTRVTGFNNTLTFKDPTFKTNSAFYNALLKSGNWHVAFRTGSKTQISENPVQVIPKNPITDDINSTVEFEIEAKWSQPLMTVPFDTPVGIFEPPFALQ